MYPLGGNKIRVAVRIRPTEQTPYWKGDTSQVGLLNAKSGSSFLLDRLFGPGCTQKHIFARCGLPLVRSLFSGYNGCLIAYGQTGSGKTYTMLGSEGGLVDQSGIVPQVANEIFRQMHRQERDAAALLGRQNMSQFQVTVSYIEVYKDKAYDLLASAERPKHKRGSLANNGRYRVPLTVFHEPLNSGDNDKPHSTSGRKENVIPTSNARRIAVHNTYSLLVMIAKASKMRCTKRTGMNEHSSRSHAILTIYLEHRWRTSEQVEQQNEKEMAYSSRETHLVLVDLAGSESTKGAHDGKTDAEGSAINKDLLALGRVCYALAQKEKFVPFRASVLTRLLQHCFVGRCNTHLIACIHGAEERAAESIRTLNFASRVGGISTSGERAETTVVVEATDDPLYRDEEDLESAWNRRTAIIETRYHGDIFSRCAGSQRDPLILYVHGSGPRNSSLQWNYLVQGLLQKARAPCRKQTSVPRQFYHVAIDCPGYGRSPGDKQTVRSYPGDLLSDVVQSLGKSQAYCLVGSSQGCCAVFNAIIEKPRLAQFLAVQHPVGHAVSRYTCISQPCLLAFDEEDAGHPISVGKLMRRYLPNPYWHQFKTSATPLWLEEHFADNMLSMMRQELQKRRQSKEHRSAATPARSKRLSPSLHSALGKANSTKFADLSRQVGGIFAWMRAHGREYEEYQVEDVLQTEALAVRLQKERGEGNAGTEMKFIGDVGDGDSTAQQWIARMDPLSGAVVYENAETRKVSSIRPTYGYVVCPGEAKDTCRGSKAVEQRGEENKLHRNEEYRTLKSDRLQRESKPRRQHESKSTHLDDMFMGEEESSALQKKRKQVQKRQEELKQRRCQQCDDALCSSLRPFRFLSCRHLICAPCAEVSLRYHQYCSICGLLLQNVTKERSDKTRNTAKGHSGKSNKKGSADLVREQNSSLLESQRVYFVDKELQKILTLEEEESKENATVSEKRGRERLPQEEQTELKVAAARCKQSGRETPLEKVKWRAEERKKGAGRRILLEIGNTAVPCTSSGGSERFTQNAFVRLVPLMGERFLSCSGASCGRATNTTGIKSTSGGTSASKAKQLPIGNSRQCAKAAEKIIRKVEFNINPSYSKPTAVLTKPTNHLWGYTLERTLGFSYSCYSTVHFNAGVLGMPQIAPIRFVYHTRTDHEFSALRVVVQLPPATTCKTAKEPPGSGKRSSKPPVILVNTTTKGGGWVYYSSVGDGRFMGAQ